MRDPFHEWETKSREQHSRVRQIIAESGPDALAEFDQRMKDVQTGVTHARNIWHSISKAQRVALEHLNENTWGLKNRATLRALMHRGLASWDEVLPQITEHGQFVLKFGKPAA